MRPGVILLLLLLAQTIAGSNTYDHRSTGQRKNKDKHECMCTTESTGAYVPSKSVLRVDALVQNVPGSGIEVEGATITGGTASISSLNVGVIVSPGQVVTINGMNISHDLGVTVPLGTVQAPNGIATQTLRATTATLQSITNGGAAVTVGGSLITTEAIMISHSQFMMTGTVDGIRVLGLTVGGLTATTGIYTDDLVSIDGIIGATHVTIPDLAVDVITSPGGAVKVQQTLNAIGGICIGSQPCTADRFVTKIGVDTFSIPSTGANWAGYWLDVTALTIGNTVTLTWGWLAFSSSCSSTSVPSFGTLASAFIPSTPVSFPIAVIRQGTSSSTGHMYININGVITLYGTSFTPGQTNTVDQWICGGSIGVLGGSVTYLVS